MAQVTSINWPNSAARNVWRICRARAIPSGSPNRSGTRHAHSHRAISGEITKLFLKSIPPTSAITRVRDSCDTIILPIVPHLDGNTLEVVLQELDRLLR